MVVVCVMMSRSMVVMHWSGMHVVMNWSHMMVVVNNDRSRSHTCHWSSVVYNYRSRCNMVYNNWSRSRYGYMCYWNRNCNMGIKEYLCVCCYRTDC